MILPLLPPWIEKPGHETCFGINASEIGAFVKIAVDTRKGQIFKFVAASVRLWSNMFDVKSSQW